MLTVEDLKKMIENLPDKTPVFVRHGTAYDDAYPATVRAFKEAGPDPIVLYVELSEQASGNHRNYPKGYRGVKEIKLR